MDSHCAILCVTEISHVSNYKTKHNASFINTLENVYTRPWPSGHAISSPGHASAAALLIASTRLYSSSALQRYVFFYYCAKKIKFFS